MTLNLYEMMALSAALAAILMVGSLHVRTNLALYALQTFILAYETALYGIHYGETHLYYVAVVMALAKALAIPIFLDLISTRIKVTGDSGTMLPAPLAMHLSIVLLGASYLLTCGLSVAHMDGGRGFTATASISLLFTGLILMLTRRIALSQIVGFLVLENGIYLFALTQTRGMPMVVEMGILLDVLVGVMIAGLLVFRIQKSFEHIDVTQLTELRD